jgi:hypothetical protein
MTSEELLLCKYWRGAWKWPVQAPVAAVVVIDMSLILTPEQLVFPYTTYLLSLLKGISICMPETAELWLYGGTVVKKSGAKQSCFYLLCPKRFLG